MKTINLIIDYYLTTKDYYTQKEILSTLVAVTDKKNYHLIVKKLETHENTCVIEICTYLNEVYQKNITGLRFNILKKINHYKEKHNLKYLFQTFKKAV